MDTLETIKCPACGKEMEKVFIKSEGINLDICTNGCGGIFFDNREFDKFNEEHEDISAIQKKLEGKTFEPVNDNAERICPACGQKWLRIQPNPAEM
jgi:Zn-finger nucleic acid-binding protein